MLNYAIFRGKHGEILKHPISPEIAFNMSRRDRHLTWHEVIDKWYDNGSGDVNE